MKSLKKDQEKYYKVQGQACDLCGAKNASVKADKSDNFLCLCSKCADYVEALPIYSKKCVERFLIGNIL